MTLRDIPALRAEAERRAQAFLSVPGWGRDDNGVPYSLWGDLQPPARRQAVDHHLDLLTDLTDPHNRDILVRLIDRYGDANDTDEATHSRDDAASLRLIALRVLGGES